jgi:hypothetical protein
MSTKSPSLLGFGGWPGVVVLLDELLDVFEDVALSSRQGFVKLHGRAPFVECEYMFVRTYVSL